MRRTGSRPRMRWIGGVALGLIMGWPDGALRAEPVGNRSRLLEKGRWMMGLSGAGTFAREVDDHGEVSIYQLAHYRGYGVTDWLSVYGKIGAAYVSLSDATIIKSDGTSSTNSIGTNVLSGGQVKIRFLTNRAKTLGWDGSIQYTDIRARRRGKNETRWHEWQFATAVSATIGPVTPYVGIKSSVVNAMFRIRESGRLLQQVRYNGQSPAGGFFGVDWFLNDQKDVVLNIEGSYLDGLEVSTALAYTF